MIIQHSSNLLFNGHEFGSYLSNENTKYAYVPISKNASNYFKGYFIQGHNWSNTFNYQILSNKTFLVILRDPIDRWLKGVVEYFYRKHSSLVIEGNAFKNFIFERIYFDEHTLPQSNFISGLDTENMIFFKFDDNIDKTIDNFVIKNFHDENWAARKLTINLFKNESVGISNKLTNLNFLIKYLSANPKYRNNIKEFYKEDYNLINSVKFYGSN